MAEGGQVHSRSIIGGSDAEFEFTCTPCGEDNLREEAVKYCPECQEYLCTRCTRHHGRQKVSKSHKLVETNDVKRGHAVVITTKCRYHGDRNIEMYCGKHDMVYCALCIATDHRSCSGVISIKDIKPSHAIHDEIQRLQSEVTDVQKQLAAADKNKRNNLERLEEQRNNAIESIETREQEMITRIRTISAQTADSVEKHYSDVKTELESDVNEIENSKMEIEKSTKQLSMFANMDIRQQFVHTKLIKSSVSSGKMIGDKSNETRNLSFTADIGLEKTVKNVTTLGRVEINVTRNKTAHAYKVKSKKEINIKMSNDHEKCYIIDICQLPDGTVLLADIDNLKIKRLDSNYNIRDHCDLNTRPTGICFTGQNEVAVKLNNDKVQFISVDTSMTKSRQIDIKCGRYWGMAYWDGSLWVSTESGVDIYSTSGTLLKSIIKDADGQNIFKDETSRMSVTGDVMIVTDYSDGALCLNKDGVVQQEIREGKLDACDCVTVSEDGTVFLFGFRSNNIMMFSLDGTCLGELVSEDDGLVKATSIFFDSQRNCLIASSYYSDNIHIFMLD